MKLSISKMVLLAGIYVASRKRTALGEERIGLLVVLLMFFICISAGGGCTSVQISDARTGLPRIVGWGSVTNIPVAKGSICRVRAPGLSLRLQSYDPGLSVGWHETMLLLPRPATPDPGKPRKPVAIGIKNVGFGLAAYYLSIGTESAFGVYQPAAGESIVQTIVFDAQHLTNSIIAKEQQ